MSKKTKIILINVLFIVLMFCIFEYISLLLINSKIGFYENLGMRYEENKSSYMRPVEIKNFGKKPIIIFGCSFAYGHGLERYQTLSYKLAQKTNRTVVNRALQGEGASFMYKQLSQENSLNEIKDKLQKDPEYLIYVYFCGHEERNFRYLGFDRHSFNETYIMDKNNKLVLYKVPKILRPFHNFTTVQLVNMVLDEHKMKNMPMVNEVFYRVMVGACEQTKQNFPNSKFVVLILPCAPEAPIKDYERNIETWNKIQETVGKDYITFIDIEEIEPKIHNKEFWLVGDNHPSAKMWDLVTDILVKKLKL